MSTPSQQPPARDKAIATMSTVAAIPTSAPQLASSEQTFYPFRRLPIELRLKIWKSSFVPRFVALTSGTAITWRFPRYCKANCECRDEHPFKEGVPAVLRTCRESRSEGLKVYKLFRTALFEGGYVNLSIDTLHFADCRHRGNGPNYDIDWNAEAGLVANRGLEESVIAMLACEAEDVKDITSLAICGCQTSAGQGYWNRAGGRTPKARGLLMKELRKYGKLSEILIAHVGTTEFVEGLGRDESACEDGIAEMIVKGPDGKYAINPATDSKISVMWDSIKLAADFKQLLEGISSEDEEAWAVPLIKSVAVTAGEVDWQQTVHAGLILDYSFSVS